MKVSDADILPCTTRRLEAETASVRAKYCYPTVAAYCSDCLLQNAMEVMCLIAVLVNCALIGLSGQVHRMFPEMSTTQTILLIVALEVRLFFLLFLGVG
jgi:hypothetical protein